MNETCKKCGTVIKKKSIIWDDYYFCSGECKSKYVFGE